MNEKELRLLVKRLERIFPGLELYFSEVLVEYKDTEEVYPPYQITWFEFIEKLEKQGLTITDLKK